MITTVFVIINHLCFMLSLSATDVGENPFLKKA